MAPAAEQLAAARLHQQLREALERVRVVLASEKQPVFADDAHHRYEDKYELAESMTNVAVASQVNSLGLLGLSREVLAWLAEGGRASSLEFRLQETCEYSRVETRTVEDPTRHVVSGTVGGAIASLTSKVLNRVEEHIWDFRASYALFAVRGTGEDPADKRLLLQRDGQAGSEAPPRERLEAVRGHVRAMQEMIAKSKKEELADSAELLAYHRPLPQQPVLCEEREGGGICMDFDEGISRSRCAPGGAAPKGDFKRKKGGGGLLARGGTPQLLSRSAPQSAAVPAPSSAPSAPPSAPSPPAEQGAQQRAAPEPGYRPPPRDSRAEEVRDLTQVPQELEARMEADLDPGDLGGVGALRPTIISPGETWTKRSQKALLAAPATATLGREEQREARAAAFDLLDALTKSGALPVEHASLHVVVAATHCFDKSLVDTLVQDSANPIALAERASLTMASVVHRRPAAALVQDAARFAPVRPGSLSM